MLIGFPKTGPKQEEMVQKSDPKKHGIRNEPTLQNGVLSLPTAKV